MYSRGVGELENIPWELLCLSLSNITDIDDLNYTRQVSPILAKLVPSCTRKITSKRHLTLADVIIFPLVRSIDATLKLNNIDDLEILFAKLPNLVIFSVTLGENLHPAVIAKIFTLLNTRANWESFLITDNNGYINYYNTTLELSETITDNDRDYTFNGIVVPILNKLSYKTILFEGFAMIDSNTNQPNPIIAAVAKVPITTVRFMILDELVALMAMMYNLATYKTINKMYCLNCSENSDGDSRILGELELIRNYYPNIYITPPYTNIRVFDTPMTTSTAFDFLDYFPNVTTVKILSMESYIQWLKQGSLETPELNYFFIHRINEAELEKQTLPQNLDRLKFKYPQINFIIVN